MIRVPSFPFSRNPVGRLLSWGSFFVFAVWRLLLLRRCDILVTMTTPPGLSVPAAILHRWLGARLWIWEMDVYPDVLIATGGLSADSLPARLLSRIFTWSRRRADGIIALGECMKRRLTASGVPENNIHIAANWADDKPAVSMAPCSPSLRILYSGNLGMAHEVETLKTVVTNLARQPAIQFLFAGGGAARPELETHCRKAGIANVSFQSYGNDLEFDKNLRECHIGLVTLRDGCQGTVVPSKVYSLLAMGRPVLFIGPSDATPALLIDEYRCGWHFAPGQTTEIERHILALLQNPEPLRTASAHARLAYERHFTRAIGVARILETLLANPC